MTFQHHPIDMDHNKAESGAEYGDDTAAVLGPGTSWYYSGYGGRVLGVSSLLSDESAFVRLLLLLLFLLFSVAVVPNLLLLGPIIVAMCLVLLLGLSLYAGGPYDGDSLRRYSDNIVDGTATPAVQDTCWEKGIFCVASPFDCADPLVSGCEPSTREGRECPGCCNGWSRYYSLWLATCN